MDPIAISLLVLSIIAVSVIAGALSLRNSRGSERGIEPGTGDHVIRISYNTGAGGGAQDIEIRVPRDPQDYARRFIPREKRK